ncbi:MAG: hypothetical protein HY901_26705 [Deltaproteobacteria bacterium]|nr:hypothetical protein [Deltaproteobacteria bacterium]
MRVLALSLATAALVLAACSKESTSPDAGGPTPDTGAACNRPCGSGCCEIGTACNQATGVCEACTLDCTGKTCGDDGCGGTCGACSGNQTCGDGRCTACATTICGGTCCASGQVCDATTSQCKACTPDCTGKDCGDNGCGGSCGTCAVAQRCVANKCAGCDLALMDCLGFEMKCGDDPATGCVCGTCSSEEYCSGGSCAYCARPLCNGACCLEGELCNASTLACQACQSQCQGKTCGDDGCGGTCAPGCQPNQACSAQGTCATCTASCGTRKCGPDKDGCSCGSCTGNDTCVDGLCQPCARPLCNGVCCAPGSKCDSATNRCQRCQPQCDGKVCGDDGCGGLCGGCSSGTKCLAGQCTACAPDCSGGKNCGDDGCGGTCGSAPCDPQQSLFCIGNKCTQCTPEQDAEICARLQAECGTPYAVDNCGNRRGPSWGAPCPEGKECDPRTFKCATPCAPETAAEFCARLERECGPASGTDNCGAVRSVNDCGSCTGTPCVAGQCQ